MFFIMRDRKPIGVAWFVDEAKQFAERMQGGPLEVTPTGALIDTAGYPSGYCIKRLADER